MAAPRAKRSLRGLAADESDALYATAVRRQWCAWCGERSANTLNNNCVLDRCELHLLRAGLARQLQDVLDGCDDTAGDAVYMHFDCVYSAALQFFSTTDAQMRCQIRARVALAAGVLLGDVKYVPRGPPDWLVPEAEPVWHSSAIGAGRGDPMDGLR